MTASQPAPRGPPRDSPLNISSDDEEVFDEIQQRFQVEEEEENQDIDDDDLINFPLPSPPNFVEEEEEDFVTSLPAKSTMTSSSSSSIRRDLEECRAKKIDVMNEICQHLELVSPSDLAKVSGLNAIQIQKCLAIR